MENQDARAPGYGPSFIVPPSPLKKKGGGNPGFFGPGTVYNLSVFLACMILLTIFSVRVLLPGNLSMALIILASAFHLSCKFLARL